MTLGQDEEAGVAHQQRQPAATLLVAPADPRIAGAQMAGGRGPGQQRQPAPAMSGDAAQMFTHQRGAFEVVMRDEELIKAGALGGADGAHDEFAQDLVFVGARTAETSGRHAAQQNRPVRKSPARSD